MLTLGNLSGLARLSAAKSRSISPENSSGQPGQGGQATDGMGASAARDLGFRCSVDLDEGLRRTVDWLRSLPASA